MQRCRSRRKWAYVVGGFVTLVLIVLIWQLPPLPTPLQMIITLKSISMSSSEEGWAVGVAADQPGYALLHYHHGQWTRELPLHEATHTLPEQHLGLSSISMVSASDGWCIGEGFLPLASPTAGGQRGVDGKVILHYSQGKWTVFDQGATDTEFDIIAMHSSRSGWMLGNNGATNTLLHYDGRRWTSVPLPKPVNTTSFNALVPVSDQEIWLAGAALAHYDGKTWTSFSLPVTHFPSSPLMLYSLSMVSPNEGWAVGDVTNTTQGVILHYMAGRLEVQSLPSTPVLSSVSMVSPKDGWAVGPQGAILRYQNGAWTPSAHLTNVALNQVITIPHAADAWAVGNNGTILHYSQGSWSVSNIS